VCPVFVVLPDVTSKDPEAFRSAKLPHHVKHIARLLWIGERTVASRGPAGLPGMADCSRMSLRSQTRKSALPARDSRFEKAASAAPRRAMVVFWMSLQSESALCSVSFVFVQVQKMEMASMTTLTTGMTSINLGSVPARIRSTEPPLFAVTVS